MLNPGTKSYPTLIAKDFDMNRFFVSWKDLENPTKNCLHCKILGDYCIYFSVDFVYLSDKFVKWLKN